VEGLENIVLSSDQMTTHGHGSQKDFFQRLEHVEVSECGDIRTLFPAKWRQPLKNLRSVKADDCKSLEEVFEFGEADEGTNWARLRLLSSLTMLQLHRLPELKCIWKGPTRHDSLQNLIHLETLRIEHCRGLKRLIREQDDEIRTESLCFPKLKTVYKRQSLSGTCLPCLRVSKSSEPGRDGD
jgi:hypothetical protein